MIKCTPGSTPPLKYDIIIMHLYYTTVSDEYYTTVYIYAYRKHYSLPHPSDPGPFIFPCDGAYRLKLKIIMAFRH